MDQRIWKFEMKIVDEGTIVIPHSSTLLKIYFQGNVLCAWFIVDANEKLKEDFRYRIIGTGNPVTSGYDRPLCLEDYLATVFDPRGFVWHVFKR